MNTINTNFMYKHSEDDYSFWNVDIDEQDYKAAMTNYVCMSGEAKTVFDRLPTVDNEPETVLHFLFENKSHFTIASTSVDTDFMNRYRDKGYSSRGTADEILAELEDNKPLTLTITLDDIEEVYVLSGALEAELENNSDFREVAIIRNAMNQVDDAIAEYFGDKPTLSQDASVDADENEDDWEDEI